MDRARKAIDGDLESEGSQMKDDEVEGLFAYGWIDAALAIVLTLLAMAALFFLAGYLI